jgi:hypothetical protein
MSATVIHLGRDGRRVERTIIGSCECMAAGDARFSGSSAGAIPRVSREKRHRSVTCSDKA